MSEPMRSRPAPPSSELGLAGWAIANKLIQTCKLNDVEPLGDLTDVLQRIVSGRAQSHALRALLQWNWRPSAVAARSILSQPASPHRYHVRRSRQERCSPATTQAVSCDGDGSVMPAAR